VFLYDWWPIRAEVRLFERLSTMPVTIEYRESASAAPGIRLAGSAGGRAATDTGARQRPPPTTIGLTDVDQSFNMKLPCFAGALIVIDIRSE
jgi:hypothetical protein